MSTGVPGYILSLSSQFLLSDIFKPVTSGPLLSIAVGHAEDCGQQDEWAALAWFGSENSPPVQDGAATLLSGEQAWVRALLSEIGSGLVNSGTNCRPVDPELQ
ncbi:hypothetical protein H920_12215 [Fukomys damarensis]|uniref:Uncharacterized protein n=1 Tax=Fukomys damarensis TaxID=885580 RepID=A0A091D7F4_FUKDA|nr:hypothetical protein H920_12215 [Fukomys damarensis]